MVDAARQVATLALLFSHHADVTQVALDAMQQEVFLTFAKDSQEIRHTDCYIIVSFVRNSQGFVRNSQAFVTICKASRFSNSPGQSYNC